MVSPPSPHPTPSNGWVPCLEFAEPELAYVSDTNANRIKITNCYQVGRGRRRQE